MNSSTLLFGLLPLLIFVIVDSFAGVRAGVLTGGVFALAELIYTLTVYHTIDELTLLSTGLILIFGFFSFRSKNDIYFKLQPVVMGICFGIVIFVMELLGKPLLVTMAIKYQYMLPEEIREAFLEEENLKVLARLSWILGFGFLAHACLVAYCAFRMSKWWWLMIRGIGFYVMMILCSVIARLSFF